MQQSTRMLSCVLVAWFATRPRNPRFKDAHTGTKRRLDVKTSNLDSGISGSVCNRARNLRFLMPLFGQKTGFRARMNEIKSGIPCSGLQDDYKNIALRCDALLLLMLRPRNPRFKDAHTGTKRRLDVKTSNRDSGI